MEIIDHETGEIIISPMTADEARQCVQQINAHMADIRRYVLDLYERRGWEALNYSSWRECVLAEFQFSESRLYQLLDAGQMETQVSTNVEIGKIPEGHLRPLKKLDTAEDRREVWQAANATAEANGKPLTASIVSEAVNARIAEQYPTPELPDNVYRCLVIDPPWPVQKIERYERPNQGAYLDYPTMSLDQIAALPVESLADANGCHMYLWVTHKFLPAGLQLLETWGFKYQCLMTWNKPTGMTPYSWMYNTEHVLFARRGNLPLLRNGMKLSFDAPVVGHSVKPDVFYERVIEASPIPRLEMFARHPREGFAVWGNEVNDEG